MRFELMFVEELKDYIPVLRVVLFSKTDEEHEKDNYDSGVYDCAVTVPDDKRAFLSIIEQCVNGCLQTYEECKDE